MKKLNYLLPVIVFACILLGLCVKGITSEDKTYSSAEKNVNFRQDRNRVLKQYKREFFRKNMRHI